MRLYMNAQDYQFTKLLHVMSYFIESTSSCYKSKLFKLLSFLDFEHFRLTGRPVTGLYYFVWVGGLVPRELNKLIKASIESEYPTRLSRYISCLY